MSAFPILDQLEVPYLYKSQEDWAQLSDYLDDPFFKRIYEESRQAYRAFQNEASADLRDVPRELGTPNPPNYRPIYNRVIKQIVERAAVLWFIDQRQEDLDYLWQALRSFLEHGVFHSKDRQVGGHGLHADLETADASYIVAFTLDTFRDLIPDEIKQRLIQRLCEESLQGYLDGVAAGDWWRCANFNWGAALHGCNGAGALAIWNTHRDLAKKVLEQTLIGLPFILDAVADGALCTEGQMYQTTSMGHLAEFLQPWYQLTGDHLGFLDNPFVALSGDFHLHQYGGDALPFNFSNMNLRTAEKGNPQFYWWARHYHKPQWATYEDEIGRPWTDTHGCFFNCSAFWYAVPHQERQAIERKGLCHFPSLDWLNFRKGEAWGAVRAGYNAHNHNHKSLGHFIFGRGQDRFFIAVGYGAGQTDMHNVITCGPQVEAARAPIVRTREWSDGMWAVCDLQPAYQNRCQICFRHYLLLEGKHLLLIDHIAGKNAKRPGAAWYLQSYIQPEQVAQGFVLRGEAHSCFVKFLDKEKPHSIQEWEFAKGGQIIQRMHWTDTADTVSSVHPTLLATEDIDVDWRQEGNKAIVELNNRQYIIDLFDLSLERS